jgi:murein L,D-transpeptidase YcbB/YkuD
VLRSPASRARLTAERAQSSRSTIAAVGLCLLVLAGPARAADATTATIRQIVDAGTHPDLRWPRFPDYQRHLLRLYTDVEFEPVWTRDGRPTMQANEVVVSLSTADARGLSASDYDAERLQAEALRLANDRGTPEAVGRFDAALTVSVMRFVSDSYIGRINPHVVGFGLDVEPKKLDLVVEATELATGEAPAARLAALDPQFPHFTRLKAALATLRARAAEGDEPLLPELPTLRPGDRDPGVPALRRRLVVRGDLPAEVAPPADPTEYDPALVVAVKRFQERHGRDADGVVGRATCADLRVPLHDRIVQIQLAMERFRWLPPGFRGRRFVIANIPEFRLRGMEGDGRVALSMPVVVGSAVKRTLTPIMQANMEYLVFRPYWDVPATIARAEILPRLEHDPAYLDRENMEIVGGRVRQRPGPANSLGLIKFIFPNAFQVYFHDTPSKRLFSRSRRDFSHGCIRVSDPVALAEFVLGPESGWDRARIADAMQNGANDRRVSLPVPVPIYIFYTTVVAEEDGRLFLYEDIYGHDAILARELARGYPYPV